MCYYLLTTKIQTSTATTQDHSVTDSLENHFGFVFVWCTNATNGLQVQWSGHLSLIRKSFCTEIPVRFTVFIPARFQFSRCENDPKTMRTTVRFVHTVWLPQLHQLTWRDSLSRERERVQVLLVVSSVPAVDTPGAGTPQPTETAGVKLVRHSYFTQKNVRTDTLLRASFLCVPTSTTPCHDGTHSSVGYGRFGCIVECD